MYRSQSMVPLSQLGINNQMVQSIPNNNFIPYNHQQQQPSAFYPPQNHLVSLLYILPLRIHSL